MLLVGLLELIRVGKHSFSPCVLATAHTQALHTSNTLQLQIMNAYSKAKI